MIGTVVLIATVVIVGGLLAYDKYHELQKGIIGVHAIAVQLENRLKELEAVPRMDARKMMERIASVMPEVLRRIAEEVSEGWVDDSKPVVAKVKRLEYNVCGAKGLGDLVTAVDKFLSNGWKLCGSVFVTPETEDSTEWFYQAMTKEVE